MRESPGRLRASTFLRRRRNRLGLNIGCVDWIRENPARAGSKMLASLAQIGLICARVPVQLGRRDTRSTPGSTERHPMERSSNRIGQVKNWLHGRSRGPRSINSIGRMRTRCTARGKCTPPKSRGNTIRSGRAKERTGYTRWSHN